MNDLITKSLQRCSDSNNNTETKIQMLTIKEAAALVDGLTEYRVLELCRSGELPTVKAGKKYLINKNTLIRFLGGEAE